MIIIQFHVVFIHGVGLDQQMWKPQIVALKEYSTITYDLLGSWQNYS